MADQIKKQLADRSTPLLRESAIGSVEFCDRRVPFIGVHKFIQNRLYGHSPGSTWYGTLFPEDKLTRLIYPNRSELGIAPKKNKMIAAHYGSSFEAEFYHRCERTGAQNCYNSEPSPSPLLKCMEKALDKLGLEPVSYQYLVTHGFPEMPITLEGKQREGTRKFDIPGGDKLPAKELAHNQRYLVGAIDLVLIERGTNKIILADLKTTSDKNLMNAGLSVENAAQLHLYTYMFERMTRLHVDRMLMLVASPLYNQVRVHSLQFHAPLLMSPVYSDQKRTLLQEFKDDSYINTMVTRISHVNQPDEIADVMEMIYKTPYILQWVLDEDTFIGRSVSIPTHWCRRDAKRIAQWLEDKGLKRYTKSLLKFTRPKIILAQQIQADVEMYKKTEEKINK